MIRVELDVVIPALREPTLDDALWSLARGSVRPDLVTIVSNEVGAERETYGLPVRILRFRSDVYPVGEGDAALKRNIGVWASPCTHVLTYDDDQIAPVDLVAESVRLLERASYFWGHHRFVDYARHTREQLLGLPPESGAPREHPPNAWHFWQSCYGGLFGAPRAVVLEVEGYDLGFCGRYGGEDQNFGRRLAKALHARDTVFVHEPPFAWHPTRRLDLLPRSWANVCAEHRLADGGVAGVPAAVCAACPYFRVGTAYLDGDAPLVPYDHARMELDIEEL